MRHLASAKTDLREWEGVMRVMDQLGSTSP